jgi:dolichyl-phosphate-mannose-protein mannosyltransferase
MGLAARVLQNVRVAAQGRLAQKSGTPVAPHIGQPPGTSFLSRWSWRLDSPAGLTTMFVAALLLRLVVAPHAGFYGDLTIFHEWATRLASHGPGKFYEAGSDYPPGYLYVLWLIGTVSASPGFLLLKLPAILSDLALACVAGTFAAALSPAELRERWPVRTLVAAAVLFNPAVITLSAVWGQIDALPATLVLASLLLILTGRESLGREVGGFLLLGAAIATKPQGAFALPVILYALSRRHLRHRARAVNPINRTLRLVAPAALGVALWFASALPFGLNPVELIRFYRDSASLYPVTSANAFNLWAVVGFWRPDSPGVAFWRPGLRGGAAGDPITVAGVSALHLGMLLLLVVAVVALWRAHRELSLGGNEAAILTVTAAALGLLSFALLTRMHERYIFYSLALLAPLVVVRRLAITFAALSALCFLNLWWVVATLNPPGSTCGLPHPGCLGTRVIFGGAGDAWQQKLWSTGVTALALLLAWFGARWAGRLGLRAPSLALNDQRSRDG